MSTPSDPGHGNSPAAWTAVVVMLVAFAVGTFAFWFAIGWLVWTCAAVVVLGLVIGIVMSKFGWGARGPRYVPKAHD